MLIRTIIEIAVAALIVVGVANEDKFIAWEDKHIFKGRRERQ